MIALFISAFGVFLLLMLAMAVGAIVANKPLTGSCGGLNALSLQDNCPVCGRGKQGCLSDSKANGAMK